MPLNKKLKNKYPKLVHCYLFLYKHKQIMAKIIKSYSKKYSDLFSKIELIQIDKMISTDDWKNIDGRIVNNLCKDYTHCPSNKLTTLDDYYKTFKKNIAKASKIIDDDLTDIYIRVNYPLETEAVIKFISKEKITYGVLFFAHTIAYQIIYDIEDFDVGAPTGNLFPNLLNRASSEGRFGIWGHVIEDLIFNGNCSIKANNTDIVCTFECDS